VTSNQALDSAPTQPWWRRVVPLSLAVLLVAALAVGLVPALREQLLLSASHRQASYVEMAFTPDQSGLVDPCLTSKAGVEVRFSVAGHGDDVGRRAWRIVVTDPSGDRTGRKVLNGTMRLPEDRPTSIREAVTGWSGPYDVLDTLPGATQRLSAHCEGSS
jgi:hypothetical protein